MRQKMLSVFKVAFYVFNETFRGKTWGKHHRFRFFSNNAGKKIDRKVEDFDQKNLQVGQSCPLLFQMKFLKKNYEHLLGSQA